MSTWLITGCSTGLGRALAEAVIAAGHNAVVTAREVGRVADLAADNTDRVLPLPLDVTDTSQVTNAVSQAEERFGAIDVLVNNAGTSAVRQLDQLRDEDWRAQWELHVMGPLALMRAAAPLMAQHREGRIVNVCSSSGKRPSLTNAAYSVSKAAQLSLSRVFADAYAKQGVLVNAVAPGAVETPLWTAEGGLADQMAAAQGIAREEVLEQARAKIPLGRLGRDDEVAGVIVFLCSARASNVTGAAWSVDGGTVPIIL